jgi:hypothetical protein
MQKRNNQQHGLSGTPIYKAWNNMMRSCYNQKCHAYFLNGARGIKVCKRWHSLTSFAEDMGDRPDNCYLKRIDKKLDYSFDNCKWQKKINHFPLPEEHVLRSEKRSLWSYIKEWWRSRCN